MRESEHKIPSDSVHSIDLDLIQWEFSTIQNFFRIIPQNACTPVYTACVSVYTIARSHQIMGFQSYRKHQYMPLTTESELKCNRYLCTPSAYFNASPLWKQSIECHLICAWCSERYYFVIDKVNCCFAYQMHIAHTHTHRTPQARTHRMSARCKCNCNWSSNFMCVHSP